MAVRAKTVAVTTTPVIVLDASKSLDGISGALSNAGSTIVFVGGDDLTSLNTATNGIPIAVGAGMDDVELPYGDVMYAVCASGTGSLSALATRV